MAKMVGLSLVVKQGWMRKAVALLDENLPEAEYRKQLEEHLSYEIDSPTNRRKAREILMKIWYLNSGGRPKVNTEIPGSADGNRLVHDATGVSCILGYQ